MKVVVVGLGYVGLSSAVLLAQHNEVIGVDILQERVDALNERQSPVEDTKLSEYLISKDLNLCANTDLKSSVIGADFVIVATPTNYDENTNFFDTSSVEEIINLVIKYEPKACIVIKSTVPVGFIDDIKRKFETDAVMFSPEFLREGNALNDNLYPNRIVVGEKSNRAKVFANLLLRGSLKENTEILLTGSTEAEAIKLFANTYLAMRVAFFNELDSYAMANNMDSLEIVKGVSLDPRIGDYYNNPSFGYGGYCLPKDAKQLLANYKKIPQNLICAIVDANSTRKDFLVDQILKKKPKIVGIFKLAMKSGSDNFRQSSIQGIMKRLKSKGIEVLIYEPKLHESTYFNSRVENNLEKFKIEVDLIITNRFVNEIKDVEYKVFTRDLFNID